MARPCKSVNVISQYSQTKDELKERAKTEQMLKGGGEVSEPPKWLTENQKDIYNRIVECLKESEMLCVNDMWLLSKTAIAIDRLEYYEKMINNSIDLSFNKDMLAAIRAYTSDFYRGCNELCLSPQSRAKLANVVAAKAENKPLESLISKINEL